MKKYTFLKIASLLMALLLTCAIFVACNGDTSETDQNDESEQGSQNDVSINVDGLAVFGNGEYLCKIVRSENASDVDKNIYNELRQVLKSVTGKNTAIATDFVGFGETLDTESPAILVGKTEYPESKQVYDKLKHGEYRMELVGNKFVIAYSHEATASLALQKFRGFISSSMKDGVLSITEKWNSSDKVESKVPGLPLFDGSTSMTFDGGDGSKLILYKDVSKEAHDAFVSGIEALGYEHYVTNNIGESCFYTYHNDESIMHIMYFPRVAETRVVIDTKEFTSLAGLESENIYEEGSTEMSFTQLGLEHPRAGNCQNGMGYILKLSDGSFVIVDGGHTRDMSYAESAGDYLLDSLKVLADDPNDIRVHTWFLSHIHNDHIGAFYDIARDTPDSIKVERLVYNAPNDTQLAGVSGGNLDDKVENAAKMFGIETVVKGHPGQVFYANEATFTIYGSLDLVEPITIDNINESSMVMKMEFMGKTMIFLGDCHPNASLALTNAYGDDLQSNFIQLSHHGYADGATLLLNETIKAEASFWPVGNYHYKNMVSKIGAVPQNAPFVNIPHYVAGDTNLTIKDFDTWIPEEKRWTPYD
jgi:beta-lactamase superfamily II metal-dependent hydrolase